MGLIMFKESLYRRSMETCGKQVILDWIFAIVVVRFGLFHQEGLCFVHISEAEQEHFRSYNYN